MGRSPGRGVGVLAVAVIITAWRPLPWSVPLIVGLAGIAAAVAMRRLGVWFVVLVLVTSSLSTAAWNAVAPTPAGELEGWVTVRTDPDDRPGVTGFEVIEQGTGRHLEVAASGDHRAEAGELQAGDEVLLSGRVAPRPPEALWLARRHVVGKVVVDDIGEVRFARGVPALTNRLRRLLGAGASSLPPDQRALFQGFVLGDDRAQSDELADRFRAAGLTHLLVVSGQNVAFALLLARPILQRLPIPARLVATVAILWVFALLTRFEPSVLRATVMAAISAAAWSAGHTLRARATLGITVIVLVLVDPLIAGQLGFVLSVAASAGILLWAAPIAERMRGPTGLRDALGVTIAAQAAVTPVLMPLSGGVNLASIPANLLAVPTSGPLMMWGLLMGPVAGLLAEGGHRGLASLLHLPSRVGLVWVEAVARWAADLPGGRLSVPLVAGLGLLGFGFHRTNGGTRGRRAVLTAIVVLLLLGVRPAAPPDRCHEERGGASVWCTVDTEGRPTQLLILSGRTRIDGVLRLRRDVPLTRVTVVVTSSAAAAQQALAAVATEVDLVTVRGPASMVPVRHPGIPLVPVSRAVTLDVGRLRVEVTPQADRLRVAVVDGG